MTEIPPLNHHANTLQRIAARRAAASASPVAPARPSDRVELSQAAQLLAKLNEVPDIRGDLVDRVRGEIANGTYETPEKLEAAMNALLEELA